MIHTIYLWLYPIIRPIQHHTQDPDINMLGVVLRRPHMFSLTIICQANPTYILSLYRTYTNPTGASFSEIVAVQSSSF